MLSSEEESDVGLSAGISGSDSDAVVVEEEVGAEVNESGMGTRGLNGILGFVVTAEGVSASSEGAKFRSDIVSALF